MGWRCTKCGYIVPCKSKNSNSICSWCIKCKQKTIFETELMTQKETEKYLRRKALVKNGNI